MKKRLYIFWRTLVSIWSTFSRTAKTLFILFAAVTVLVIIFSSEPGFIALLCLGLLSLGSLSGYVSYRLFWKGIK